MTEPGDLIAGRYRFVNQIAAGGMGSVWEARDELLRRPVAVKQLLIAPGLSDGESIAARSRVIREARITARLHHPHAVTLYDVVEHDGRPCLIMQFVRSKSLGTVLRETGPLEPSFVIGIGIDIASALAAAHDVGIVHRDVKPGNVLITDDGSAKLTDFGISHAAGDVTVTSTGLVTGTPAYLAPEVARGAESGFASDVFSLGATLYAALEGAPPFGTDSNQMAVLHRVASGRMNPPRRSGPLTPLLLAMLAADPRDRPRMVEVGRALEALRPGTVPPAATPRPAIIAPPASPERVADLTATQPFVPFEDTGAPRSSRSSRPAGASPRRGRASVVVALAGLLLAASILVGFRLLGADEGGQTAAATTAAAEQGSGSRDETVGSSPDISSSTTPGSAPNQSPANSPESGELASAITNYYALMPASTDQGWQLLTANFQSGTARNRDYYQSFWDTIDRVEAGEVTGVATDSAVASITYHFKDGRVSVERTAFNFVRDNGILKIDSTSVLSSQ
jgi:eukaryotic-like serine/threonine-protein kinase